MECLNWEDGNVPEDEKQTMLKIIDEAEAWRLNAKMILDNKRVYRTKWYDLE